MTSRPPTYYDELTDPERRAMVRSRVKGVDEDALLELWRVLGLPLRDVVQESVDDVVGEPRKDAEKPGSDGQPIERG